MKTLEYTIEVQTTAGRLWNCLWESENYQAWTSVFCEGSHYLTDAFAEGNKIHLLTPGGEGMYSILDKIIENNFLAFRHLGEMKNFEEQPIDEAVQGWTNAIESYEIIEREGGVELLVKVDTVDEYVDHMNKSFPQALQKLKQLAEAGQ
jgi:hypothetical protein